MKHKIVTRKQWLATSRETTKGRKGAHATQRRCLPSNGKNFRGF